MTLPVLTLTGVQAYDYFFTLGLAPLFPIIGICGVIMVIGYANQGY